MKIRTKKYRLLLILLLSGFVANGQNRYELLFLQNRFNVIIDIAEQRIESATCTADDFYWYSITANKTGDMTKNIEILAKGTKKYPENEKLRTLLAQAYFDIGDYAKAKKLLEALPRNKQNKMKLAAIYEFNTDYYQAAQIYYDLHRQDTTNMLFLKDLGNNYYRMDSLAKAAFFYEKAWKINPCSQPVAFRLARIYQKTEEYEKSIERCYSILTVDSLNTKFIKQAAFSYFKWEKYEQSKHLWAKILEIGDTTTFVIKYLGISEMNCRNFHVGRDHLLMAYERDTSDFEICFYLGRAYLNSMEKEKGLDFLRKANALIQPKPKVLTAISQEKATILNALHRYREAIAEHKKSYTLSKNPKYLFYIASIYHKQLENKTEALKYYELFLDKLPPEKVTTNENENKGITINLQKLAKEKVTELREELFFEGKLETNNAP